MRLLVTLVAKTEIEIEDAVLTHEIEEDVRRKYICEEISSLTFSPEDIINWKEV